MMPKWLAVPFLIGVGAAVLWVAYRGYQNGEVRAGSSFWRVYRLNRVDNPFAFRFFLALYFCCGIALCVWGLLAMVGMAPSLRWH
jgi:hypothetical protein